jgi:heavy metal sensor kinase
LKYQGPIDELGQLALTFDQMLIRLENAFERERRFTGDAAHELRTPLTALKGQIEVTLSQPRDLVEYENKLRELASQVERLIRLSNALLFLSLSDQKRLSWNPVNVDLEEILDMIIEQITPLAEEKKLAFTTDFQADLSIVGDIDHLTRLFLNIFDNAIKYTPKGGKITVKTERDTQNMIIDIHNSGPGIPMEHLPHLFDRFYRVETDRSSQTGGTGLGLAIVQEIVRLHVGKISVTSGISQGVRFTLSFPATN